MPGRSVATGIALAAACLSACAASPDTSMVFEQPVQDVFGRLETAERVVEGTGMGSLTIETEETGDNTAVIGIRRAGDRRTVPCHVTMSAVTEKSSRVEVDCHQPGPGKGATTEVAIEAITLVMREHVAAAVEDRQYDIDGVANAMMMLIATNGHKLAPAMPGNPGNEADSQ